MGITTMDILHIGGRATPIATQLKDILRAEGRYQVKSITPQEFLNDKLDQKNASPKRKAGLILAELSRFKIQPIAAVRTLKKRHPETPLLAMHYYDRPPLINPLINAGADHYLRLGSNIAEQKVIETVSALAETD